MVPIIVTAAGRSGTTLLMAALAQSPQVCVAELLPYEVRLVSYYATAFRTLTAPADTARSMHPDRLERDAYSVGFNPFNDAMYHAIFHESDRAADFFDSFVPQALRQVFHNIITEYYTRLAADQGKRTPVYFAEKNNNLARVPRDFARATFPEIKEIVLYRDPRDLFCSHKSYFRSSSERAIVEIKRACHDVEAILDDAGPGLLAISYENMLQRPIEVQRTLSEFLGYPVLFPKEEAQGSAFQRHGTSKTPMASIGRWKTDMSEAEQAAGLVEWQDFLVRFGYIPAAAEAPKPAC